MRYEIFEGNLDRLEKKLARIEKKCKKYDADFHYEVVGETYREVESEGETCTTRFVIVDVEGFAKINNWEFIATVDHTENGNIIRNIVEIEIPDRYRTSDGYCEHCNTSRRRKNTFLIHNTETDEFKQVGRSCLRDYTGGYDAELAAAYISLHNSLIEAEDHSESSPYFGFFNRYHDLDEVLKMSVAVIKKLGFTSTSAEYGQPSKYALIDLMNLVHYGPRKHSRYLIDAGVSRFYEEFDNLEYIQNLKNYYLESDETSNYMQNMKVIFSSPYCKQKDFGYIVSAVFSYDRAMEKKMKTEEVKKQKAAEIATSEYIGEIKEKITRNIVSACCLTSYEVSYGGYYDTTSYLYKFTDDEGNCIMWSTSKNIDLEKVTQITGIVKDHKEYKGLKQTWMTRCKVEYSQEENTSKEACIADEDLLRCILTI